MLCRTVTLVGGKPVVPVPIVYQGHEVVPIYFGHNAGRSDGEGFAVPTDRCRLRKMRLR